MLKRISSVRDFGVFNNFSGNTMPEFGLFNLVYGWNYSGKTTLSRVFRCLEASALHRDYPDATFSLTHSDGVNRDHSFGSGTIVRVFNEDFRKDNLFWDDASGFNPIVLLGAENIGKQQELADRKLDVTSAIDARTTAVETARRHTEIINNAESECATLIVRELGAGRFDRRHVRQVVETWPSEVPAPLDDEVFRSDRLKLSVDQKEELPDLHVDLRDVHPQWGTSVSLLGEQLGSSGTIPRLAENPEIGNWVGVGLHIHKNTTHCEFCLGVIEGDRLRSLNAHFSTAFVDLKSRLEKAVEWLETRIVVVDGATYSKSQFYPDLHEEHAAAGAAFKSARDEFNSALQDLVERLRRKSDNPFETVSPPEVSPLTAELRGAAERFQSLIDENNRRTREFASERGAAFSRLKDHYVASAMQTIDLRRLQREIEITKSSEAAAVTEIARLEVEIARLQQELSETTKGAIAINDALRRFFGKNDIQVTVTDDDRFMLMRGDSPARNLSEGERTAIAFCYFVTKLLENGNLLADTIVYIDDPISSLDSHHLIHVNAFLKDTFLKYDENATPRYGCLAKQVFVSTHNYEFFHLCWEWMQRRKIQGFSAAFMVERIDSNGVISSRIIECPKSILQFRSEYLFLYHQLAAYANSPSNDAMVIFNLGNMARRFVEGYLAFKFFEHQAIDSKLPLVIKDTVQCERARKFMHFYSHSLNRGGGLKLPDMSEAQAAVSSILDGIRDHDPIHFSALQSAG